MRKKLLLTKMLKLKHLLIFSIVFLTIGNINAQCPGPPGDCDGDGVLDTADLDDDNDGVLDTEECVRANDEFVYHLFSPDFNFDNHPGDTDDLIDVFVQELGLGSNYISVSNGAGGFGQRANIDDADNNLAYDDSKWYVLKNNNQFLKVLR